MITCQQKTKIRRLTVKNSVKFIECFLFFSDSMRITARVLVEVPKNVLVAG